MASASDSTFTPSRRQFFGSAAGAGVAAAQPPIFLAGSASTLAIACDWCANRRAWISSRPDSLNDAMFQAECERMDLVFQRAVTEPSLGIGDVAAKARMLLQDLIHGGADDEEHDDTRLTLVVLREIVALAA